MLSEIDMNTKPSIYLTAGPVYVYIVHEGSCYSSVLSVRIVYILYDAYYTMLLSATVIVTAHVVFLFLTWSVIVVKILTHQKPTNGLSTSRPFYRIYFICSLYHDIHVAQYNSRNSCVIVESACYCGVSMSSSSQHVIVESACHRRVSMLLLGQHVIVESACYC